MISELLEKRKTFQMGLGLAAAAFLATRLFVRPAPVDVFMVALLPALAAGLSALAIVLIYRSVRIINWAQFALGVIAAQLFYELYIGKAVLPYGASLAVGLIVGPLMGVIIGIVFATLFFRHPRLVLTVATILVVGLVGFAQGQIDGVFHEPGEVRNTQPVLGPWPDSAVDVGGTPFRFAYWVSLGILVLLSIALVIFFRRTRVGTAVRAAAENADRASLLGINVKLLQVGVWALVGFIASVGAIAVLPVDTYRQTAGQDFLLLLLPLSAAVVARMSSLPIAFATATGFVLLRQAVQFSAPNLAVYSTIGLFMIITGGLLFQRRRIKVRADDTTSWKAAREVRPTPRELLDVSVVARSRRVIMLLVMALVLAFPWLVSFRVTGVFAELWVTAIIATSLVILTGWSGQISLGQYALVTVGAFIAGNMTARWGIPFWFAVPLTGAVGAVFSVFVGLPALRIRGLFLAVETFALAALMPILIFDEGFLGKWVPDTVHRPSLFFLDFQDNRSIYYLLLITFVAVALGVQALRRSRAGRVLIALRDNESGAQSFGVDVVRTRLAAFAVSGFLAAVGGALVIHLDGGMSRGSYGAFQSIQLFILIVIGGVSSVMGAVLGSVFFVAVAQLIPGLRDILQGVLGLFVLMFIPGGLTQIVFGSRDAILRVIAMRQNIIVPSLFADYSPEAWEKRLAPLSPPLQTQGLAALKPDQRYALPSVVAGKVYDVGPPAWEGGG